MADHKKSGRPTALTPELAKAICDTVRRVGFQYVAAERNGIHRNTLINWLGRGEEGEEPYASFADAFAEARSEWVEAQADRAAVADPRWALERADPQQFRPPPSDVNLKGDLTVSYASMSSDELKRRMLAAIEGREYDDGKSNSDV